MFGNNAGLSQVRLTKLYLTVTVQQAYAFTAYAVRKHIADKHKSITKGDFAWICARNYEGTE